MANNLKELAKKRLAEFEPQLFELSQWLYDNPELGLQEHEASARISTMLANNGFEVEFPAYGLDTAFVARAGRSGPEVIVCAEYDALPSIGHACGHNIIAASAVGAGVSLATLADELGCRVTVLGTPAEEGYGAKVDLLNAGAFADASAAMMVHPAPHNELTPNILAVLHVDVEFHGKDSHAAFAPHLGVNALDAFVQAYVNISTLRQHILPSDRIHGIVTHGGDAANIVPHHTASSWYIRSQTQERLDELVERVMNCFDAAATATGCTWTSTTPGNSYSNMTSNSTLAELFAANSQSLGRPMPPGDAHTPSGSTDMGNVSHVVPTIHPMIAIDCAGSVNHQPEFAAATITPSGQQAIHDGALAMAWTIIDVATEDSWSDL
ncbi:MAG: M20 family metallopeptidase [Acidimicrobiales bacterium]